MNLPTGNADNINALVLRALSFAPTDAAPRHWVRIMPLGDLITEGYFQPGGYRKNLCQLLTSAGYDVDFVGTEFTGLTNAPKSR